MPSLDISGLDIASRRRVSVGPLSVGEVAAVVELAAEAAAFDGVAPISEAPLLHLGSDSPLITHIIVRSILHDVAALPDVAALSDDSAAKFRCAAEIVGYAQIDRSGKLATAELVIHPGARRLGIGRALLKTAEADARLPAVSGAGLSAGKPLRVWAHGDLPAAQAFAAAVGYAPVRELLLLSRPLNNMAPPTTAPLPSGYELRRFRPGQDDAAWVAANALIFADHPEQGRLTIADLQARQAEPWFNPEVFNLVVDLTGEVAAFCWAKVDSSDSSADSGEIYAIGVHPAHQRNGLATYLLETAFAQLKVLGLNRATLYVEGDNEAALAAYYRAGLAPITADIQYARRK